MKNKRVKNSAYWVESEKKKGSEELSHASTPSPVPSRLEDR